MKAKHAEPSSKSWRKFALKGQNNGTLTKKQRAQSLKDKRAHKESIQPHAQWGSSQINFGRPTLFSGRQKKNEKSTKYVVGRTQPTNQPITELLDSKGRRKYSRLSNGAIVMNKQADN